jgi:aspartyl-tRNA(Asn)/glutamyl-tRNA(Gln) amidotransferase subunit A
MAFSSYCEFRERLIAGRNSTFQEILQSFRLIEEMKGLNLFISTRPEKALAEASQIDSTLHLKSLPKLAGLTLAVKDCIAVEGERLTCGSQILSNFISPYNATVVARLKCAGAIILGKTNQDEFAMGSSNENSGFGPARNPHNPDRVPGGSSGGSAGAVAAGMAYAALGSDTGGSVRQPAAFCGVVGLRPTYGWFSRYGLVAFASSMDQIGPIARSVEDVALICEVAGGYDPLDSTSINRPVPEYSAELLKGVEGFRVGLPREYFTEGLDAEIRDRINSAVEQLKQMGVKFIELNMPHTDYAIACYQIITTAECSSNLARYDGARYGYRTEEKRDLLGTYRFSRGGGFGPEVKRRIMLGTYVLSAGYYEAYYKRAQKVRRLITEDFLNAFKEADLLITPVTPTPAFKIGEKVDDPLQMYLSDIYTAPSSIAGVPGLSVPVGLNREALPLAIGIIGPHFGEAQVLRLGRAIEGMKW